MDTKQINIFISYAQEDTNLKDELDKHLTTLKRQGLISIWNNYDINAGQEWEKETNQHLKNAEIILLLISPDFIASDYYNVEMQHAMEQHKLGTSIVIPIMLRHTHWYTPFSELQPLPKNGSPIKSWVDIDQAFTSIAHDLEKIAKDLLKKHQLTEISKLYELSRFYEALNLIDDILELDPECVEANLKKGIILYKLGPLNHYQGDRKSGLHLLEKVIQTDPMCAEAYIYKSKFISDTERDLAQALTAIETGIKIDPNNDDAHYTKATILADMQNYEGALIAINQAIHLNPEYDHYYGYKAALHSDLRQYEECLQSMDEAIKFSKDPDTKISNYIDKAEIYFYNLSQPEKSLEILNEAEKFAFSQDLKAGLHEAKGRSLYGMKEYNKSIEEFNKQLENKNDRNNKIRANYNIGMAHFKLKEYELALVLFNQVIEMDPKYFPAYRSKEKIYLELANEAGNKAKEINKDPEHKKYHYTSFME